MDDLLTTQDKTFVKEFVETGNKTKSARKAYKYKNNNLAGVMALDKLRKPKIINAIKTIADSIPDKILIKVHLEGLKATTNDKPDYSVRHKYMDSGYKLKGYYIEKENQVQNNIFILPMELIEKNDKNEMH